MFTNKKVGRAKALSKAIAKKSNSNNDVEENVILFKIRFQLNNFIS